MPNSVGATEPAKWPAYYPDSFGSAVDIGPGSPTGICFGYGTKFPQKYQDALFICDWSYGNIHAVHLTPDGSSYTGTYETFATAAPLPVTDLVVRPQDGMLYFTIGGRKTQSGLYRIRYTGELSEQDASAAAESASELAKAAELRAIRQSLEALHQDGASDDQISTMMDHLSHADRGVRFAARIALEHQSVDRWQNTIEVLNSPQAQILGVVALARHGKPADKKPALEILNAIDWDQLSSAERIDLLRAYGLVAIRLGRIDGDQAEPILAKLRDKFPTATMESIANWPKCWSTWKTPVRRQRLSKR